MPNLGEIYPCHVWLASTMKKEKRKKKKTRHRAAVGLMTLKEENFNKNKHMKVIKVEKCEGLFYNI